MVSTLLWNANIMLFTLLFSPTHSVQPLLNSGPVKISVQVVILFWTSLQINFSTALSAWCTLKQVICKKYQKSGVISVIKGTKVF